MCVCVEEEEGVGVKEYGEEEAAFGHVIGMANCSLIGGALLYWSRDGSW